MTGIAALLMVVGAAFNVWGFTRHRLDGRSSWRQRAQVVLPGAVCFLLGALLLLHGAS
ncbi:hypothetical protein [Quadrisphaera sp. INWT6]|uniref:hypothetical protein n=1 Tax=Quadrisphaera sp. INWT6 TaxID=2596917 RepID=UPI001892153A|nr:hypothetical protein [Quadrisphaera sp. INWT6]